MRVRLLDAAGKLLAEEGPQALSLRKLATEVGTSTTAVYSLFGGKPELMTAIYAEADRRFGADLSAVEPTEDPLADLARLALAYRNFALTNPHLYVVMFGRECPEEKGELDPEHDQTFGPLLDLVRRASAAGLLLDVDPVDIAMGLWAIVHGLMSLELSRNLTNANFELVVTAALRGWLRNPG